MFTGCTLARQIVTCELTGKYYKLLNHPLALKSADTENVNSQLNKRYVHTITHFTKTTYRMRKIISIFNIYYSEPRWAATTIHRGALGTANRSLFQGLLVLRERGYGRLSGITPSKTLASLPLIRSLTSRITDSWCTLYTSVYYTHPVSTYVLTRWGLKHKWRPTAY